MASSINTWSIVFLIAAAQGIFLSVILLLHRRGNRRANFTLAALIFVFSGVIIEYVVFQSRYYSMYPHLLASTYAFPFLFGPLLYLYTRFLIQERDSFFFREILHFLPFILCSLYILPAQLRSAEGKINFSNRYLYSGEYFIDWENLIVTALVIIQMAVYGLLSLRLLQRHTLKLKNTFTSVEKINLSWLRYLVTAFLALLGLVALYYLQLWIAGYAGAKVVDNFIILCISAIIYAIGYKTLSRPEVFSGAGSAAAAPRYEYSGLTPEKAEHYRDLLIRQMENEKPYLDSELKLPDLAERLSILPHHLSQVVNEQFEQNFFDFINSYRVKEAQAQLRNPRNGHLTILAIAYEVGFNSKTAFNRAFKKHTGITPSQFLKSHPV